MVGTWWAIGIAAVCGPMVHGPEPRATSLRPGAAGVARAGERAAIAFEEVSAAAGVARSEKTFGAAWGDVNGDGRPDLWVCHHNAARPVLYVNRGDGTFAEQTKEWFGELALVDFHASAFGDFDGDGDQDLVTLVGAEHGKGAGAKLLWVNEGGRFVERAKELGLDDPLSRGRTPLWVDWNRDGRLDVIFTNRTREDGKSPTTWFARGEKGFAAAGTFAEDALLGNRAHAQLCDLEFDGSPELFFVFTDRSLLVRVDVEDGASGVARESGSPADDGAAGAAPPVQRTKLPGAMDAAVADLDGDGVAEVVPVGPMRHDGVVALTIRAAGQPMQRRPLADASPSLITSIAAGDFDNDGDVDLFLVSARQDDNDADVLLENRGERFVAVPRGGGAAGTSAGLGDSVAVADYDNDGFLDLFVTNGRGNDSDPGPCQLFRNRGRAGGNENHWLEVELDGTRSNRDGLGAVVRVTAGGRTQRRVRSGGMHAFTQDHARLHFGLGEAKVVAELVVHWPSGALQTLTDVPADQLLRLREPER